MNPAASLKRLRSILGACERSTGEPSFSMPPAFIDEVGRSDSRDERPVSDKRVKELEAICSSHTFWTSSEDMSSVTAGVDPIATEATLQGFRV